MNLMQFLAVGQSFIGIKNAPSPYRLAKQNWLPKFAPPTVSTVMVQNRWGTTGPKSSRSAVPGPKLDPAPLKSAGTFPSRANTPAQERKPARSLFPRFRSTIKPGVRLHQGELSLDTVTVVHNDLSDTDWEIVPKRPVAAHRGRPEKPSAVSAPTRTVAEPSGSNGWFKSLFRMGRGMFFHHKAT